MSFAKAHAVFARFLKSNLVILGMAAEDIAFRRGALLQLRVAYDHNVAANSCTRNSEIRSIDAEAIAASSGACIIRRVAHAQGMLVSS
eukprot:CAMPEP_0183530664 /NCGR_PEP_ID=MMETSP0371-20130417/24276_1 /TAXON_ID=268820 /ORGANISM="Peridinium aciculiferum, Strain PAER-2" /LENGTH=87 /DNA_ID=CAMNT_0025730595 /DNA_START=27 /DNA_END=290 /DNA_ORIENTATION=-